jgi:hypothetical protein
MQFCKKGIARQNLKNKKLRKSHTIRFKANVLHALRQALLVICLSCAAYAPGRPETTCLACGQENCRPRIEYKYEVADEFGVHKSLLSKWKKKQDGFIEICSSYRKYSGYRKLHGGFAAYFPAVERKLYEKFLYRRTVKGLTVDGYWLRAEFRDLLNKEYGEDGWDFQLSNGWAGGFVRRFNISCQLRTEKKMRSAVERLASINSFHTNLAWVQRKYPQRCPVWGAFPPHMMWNADHIPMPFCINLKRSFNSKNSPCWIAVLGASGLDKRQCTVHPCIRGSGEQLMPPFIIFRGLCNITTDEQNKLNALKNIKWAFQKKAWADTRYSRMWLRTFAKVLKDNNLSDQLLFLDDLSCQSVESFRTLCVESDVIPFPVPPGLTDLLQPVDHHVGAQLKRIMNGFYKIELELNYDDWRNYKRNKSLDAMHRRVLMATWLDAAWGHLKDHPKVLEDSFTHTVRMFAACKQNKCVDT